MHIYKKEIAHNGQSLFCNYYPTSFLQFYIFFT
nr:MAG TPA: hypothetical protein [Caudoviricetes sp.]